MLDVFATEPLPLSSPLWDLDNVLISSHTADNTADWQARAVERGMENLERWFRDAPPLYAVDKTAGY